MAGMISNEPPIYLSSRKSHFLSSKTYGHEVGLSATFRQWRAKSHCQYLHGYALAFKFMFEARNLDDKNWVVDFGSLKRLKMRLESDFDHKLVVAKDDPELETFLELQRKGLALVVLMDNVGCEAFAYEAFIMAQHTLVEEGYGNRVRVVSVQCSEHAGNSAIYMESE